MLYIAVLQDFMIAVPDYPKLLFRLMNFKESLSGKKKEFKIVPFRDIEIF